MILKTGGRAWLNLGLAVGLAGLALVAWLKPGQPPPAERQLTALAPDAITHMSIERPRQPAIEFERPGDQWLLTSPMKALANEVRVGELLALATTISDMHYRTTRLNLAKYGLATPKVSVKLNNQTLAFGDINPVTYTRYVRVGDTVYLISDNLPDLETAEAAAYVTPRLLPAGTEIRALALPGVELELTDGGWKSSPEKLSERDVEALLDAWRDAQAYEVASYKKANTKPLTRVTVRLVNGQVLRFEVTARKPQLILARPDLDIQYQLPAGAADSLLHTSSRAVAP